MAPTFSDSDSDSFFDDEDDEMSNDEWQSKPIKEEEPQSSKPKLSKHLEQLQSRLGKLKVLHILFCSYEIQISIANFT